jgi:Tol biopolymer transport system component
MAWPRLSRHAALAVVLIGAVAAAACGGSSSHVRAGEIVFTRSIGEWPKRYDLYVVAPDGGRARLFVRDASEAAVSPDGRQVAFVRDRAIWLMERDGRHQRPLTKPKHGRRPYTGVEDMTPAWAPDGEHVYFERFVWKTYSSSIYGVEVGGNGLRRLTVAAPSDHGHCQGRPAPSPDGRIVVFDETYDCEHGSDPGIAAVTTTGRKAQLPVAAAALGYRPAWAPDGHELAWSYFDVEAGYEFRVGDSGVYVAAPHEQERRVSPPPSHTVGEAAEPAWAPDGRSIAFVIDPPPRIGREDGDIWIVRRDGSNPRRLTHTRANDREPTWLAPT